MSFDLLNKNLALLSLQDHQADLILEAFTRLNINNYVISVDGSTLYSNYIDEVKADIATQLSKDTDKIYQPLLYSEYSSQNGALFKDILQEDQPFLALNCLPSSSDGLDNSHACLTSLVLGFDFLLGLDQLRQYGFQNFLFVESDPVKVALALSLVDLTSAISKLKDFGCGLHLSIGFSLNVLQDSICNYAFFQNVPVLYGTRILKTRYPGEDLISLYSWLHSSDGFSEHIIGAFGNDTDEINQLMHTIWNLTSDQPKTFISSCSSLEIASDTPVILLGSGPSIDQSIIKLSEYCLSSSKRPLLFTAGSALGVALRNGIPVSYSVFLEMGQNVYDDLQELILEGFNIKDIDLICSTTVDPRIVSLFKSATFFARPFSSSVLLGKSLGDAALLHSGPQALNASYDVICKLGATNIFLLGCDFSSTSSTLERSKDAIGSPGRDLIRPIANNFNKTVFSDDNLIYSAMMFDMTSKYYGIKPHLFTSTILKEQVSHSDSDFWELLDSSNLVEADSLVIGSDDTDYDVNCTRNFHEACEAYFKGISSLINSHSAWSHQLSRELSLYVNAFMISPQDSTLYSADLLLLIQRMFRYALFLSLRPLYTTDQLLFSNGKRSAIAAIEKILLFSKYYQSVILFILDRPSTAAWSPKAIGKKFS